MAKIDQGVLSQEFRRPAIYLDHWAVMRLAENHCMHFVEGVRHANATVLLTMGMLSEFHNVISPRTAEAVEKLLNLLMTNVYMASFLPAGPEQNVFPATDLRLLSFIAMCPRPMDVTGLISAAPVADQKDKDDYFRFRDAITATIVEERSKPDIVRRARTWRPDVSESLFANLLRGLKREAFLDAGAKFDTNDSADLLHSIHATQYADYALLDGKWAVRAESVAANLCAHGLQLPQTRMYSERRGGLDRFLSELAAADPAASIVSHTFAMPMSEVREQARDIERASGGLRSADASA
jgi:hypothetical protein